MGQWPWVGIKGESGKPQRSPSWSETSPDIRLEGTRPRAATRVAQDRTKLGRRRGRSPASLSHAWGPAPPPLSPALRPVGAAPRGSFRRGERETRDGSRTHRDNDASQEPELPCPGLGAHTIAGALGAARAVSFARVSSIPRIGKCGRRDGALIEKIARKKEWSQVNANELRR